MVTSQRQDETALTERAGRVHRYLRSLVNDEDVAHDLTQDVLLRLGAQPDAPDALVFTIARNLGISHLRKRRVRRLWLVSAGDDDRAARVPGPDRCRPDRALDDTILREDLLAALASLPEDQRSVFHLTEIEGLSHDAVAQVLGIPPGTVASRKHHAVRRLREDLRRRGHDA